MERIACNYHPRVPARWRCPRCEIALCPGCVQPPRNPYQEAPNCPLCEKPAESLGLGNVIVPFWRRLPRIFAYPLQANALLYLLGLSGLSLLIPLPLTGLLVLLLVALAILQYSFRVLAHTASGHLEPPEVAMRGEDVTARVIAMGLVYWAMGYLASLAGFFLGIAGYLLANLFFTLMLPASIIIVALEEGALRTLVKAVNPVSLTALAIRIGPAYLLLFVFLFLLTGGAFQLAALLAGLVPGWAASGALAFGLMYMHLVTFHLLGYVIYQYHEELGYEVDVRADQSGGEARPTTPAGPGGSALSQADVLLKEGELERAEELLRRRIDDDPTDLAAWDRYYRVLEAGGDDARLVHESKDYISALLLAGRVGPAVRVAAEALRRDRDFRPAKPEQVHGLAQAAREAGWPRLALRLMNGFGREHPEHPDLPAVSVLSARILSEDLAADDRARPILQGLVKRFPDHPETAEAQRLLRVIGPA